MISYRNSEPDRRSKRQSGSITAKAFAMTSNIVHDNLTELEFIIAIRAVLEMVDVGYALDAMQKMSDEIAKRPGMDHKLTTMAKWLIVLRKTHKNE